MNLAKKVFSFAIFITLLNPLGCTSNSGQNKSTSPSDTLEEQITNSIEDFKNQHIHMVLTEQIIDSTADDELLQVVFDNLSGKLPSDYNEGYQTVMTWNKSRQAIYMIWLLEGEVNNGGYNQFYFNSSGQFSKHLPDALKLVGSHKFADLTQRANETYEKENSMITKHQDGTLEGFSKSYKDNPLSKYDDEFYKLYDIENLQEIQIGYIRKNKTEFVDK